LRRSYPSIAILNISKSGLSVSAKSIDEYKSDAFSRRLEEAGKADGIGEDDKSELPKRLSKVRRATFRNLYVRIGKIYIRSLQKVPVEFAPGAFFRSFNERQFTKKPCFEISKALLKL
jgi:hypothetical protein